jgi:GT2 family glycosyltransferase
MHVPRFATAACPSVSVVIVNYNAGEVLRASLESSLAQATEVVLVDNASEPAGFERVVSRFAGHPRLTVVRSARNVGFAAGCNLGLERCSQPTVLFLNPDSVPAPGAVATLLATLERNPGVGMVGGLLLCTNGSEQGGGRRAVPTPWRSFVRGFGLARLGRRWPTLFNDFHLHCQPLPNRPIAVEAISGACMMVSKRAIDRVGAFDEGYFLHCEDLDYCMRVRAAGLQILFHPQAPVLHHKGACSRDRQLFVEWHKHKGMVRFYRKHFRHQYPAGLMGLVTLGVWLRFAAVSGPHLLPSLRRWLATARPSAAPAATAAPAPRSVGMLSANQTVPS